MNPDDARRELQSAGHTMVERELTWGNAGNLSLRLDESRFLVTASGTKLGELQDGDFATCSLDGETAPGPARPSMPKASKEVPMHRAVYQVRPDVQAVLHGAPFYSTLAACSRLAVPAGLFVESMYYLERLERVPYRHPGSEALGEAVREAAARADVLLLENHGVLVCGVSVAEALQGLQVLELACRMVVTAHGADISLRPLPPETVSDFLDHAGYKPKRQWPS